MEACFADSAAIWTDFASTELRRADGTVPAKAPKLSLAFLGARTYGDGRPRTPPTSRPAPAGPACGSTTPTATARGSIPSGAASPGASAALPAR
jgi:hypothetical protein